MDNNMKLPDWIAITGFLAAALLALPSGATAASPETPNHASAKSNAKQIRHDPAFRAGYDDGYRQGANDSLRNSNVYRDESGAVYENASDGYAAQYGDLQQYRKLFRLGYVDGYKAGWDFNVGQYCGMCGPGGP